MPNVTGTPTNLWVDERGQVTEMPEGETPTPTLTRLTREAFNTGILEVQHQADERQRQEHEDRLRRMEQELYRRMTGRTDPRTMTPQPPRRPTPPWATPNADFWMFDELQKPVEAMEITLRYKGINQLLTIPEIAIKDITTTESQEYIAMKVVEAIKEQWGGKLDEKK